MKRIIEVLHFVGRNGLALSLAGSLVSCSAKLNAPIPLNARQIATLNTSSGFAIAPTAQIVSTGGQISFSAVGGSAPYTYDVYYGGGTVQTTNGTYTAPSAPGDAVVRAHDAIGSAAYATILITDVPLISPQTKTLAVNNWFPFTVSGGSRPYTFSVVSGGGAIAAATGQFTAPASPGTTVIQVADSQNRTSTATITIQAALVISPKNPTVPMNSNSLGFSTTGGVAPVTYSVVSGGGQVDSVTGIYSAPSTIGMAVVKAQDSVGNTDFAFITVSNPILISPPTVTIAKGTNFTFSASGGTPPYNYSVPGGAAQGSIVAGSGVYTAPSAPGGPYTVTVTDSLGKTSNSQVTVTNSLSFAIPNVILAVGNSYDFGPSVTGGVAPVSFRVPQTQGTFAGSVYTAPATPGTYTVTAQDSQSPTPNTATATVTVNPALALAPSLTTMMATATSTFSASGGVPPYAYSVQSGGGTITSSGAYTAPAASGTAVVKVTDALGNTATSNVTINGALAISPSAKTMTTGASFTFGATGGVGAYTFSVKSGGGTVNPSTGAYTAPAAAGTAVIRVTDAQGNTSDSNVTIVKVLTITPSPISLLKGTSITFSASGGVAPYTYSVFSGGGTINSGTGAYTAPASAGSAVVRATDSLGNTANSNVTIYDGLAISPFAKTLVVNGTSTFSATGGVAPYAYSVLSGGGTINSATGSYSAPASAGSAVVRVTDSAGSTSDATVTINAVLAISPTAVSLAVNNHATFTASGGIAPLTFSATNGTINASTGDYTAPATAGTATVTVTDSTGATANASVTINAALSITPSSWTMGINGTKLFNATGGVGALAYSVVSGGGSFAAATYTAPATPGNVTVRVTDSLGNTSDAGITVYGTLAIAPTSKTLAVNDNFTFTASGGVLPYSFSATAGSFAGAVYTAPATAGGPYTITVTDSASPTPNTATATVTINSALSISPLSVTLNTNATQTFTAAGGVGPYSYSVSAGGGSFSSNNYTAPASAGSATVQVTDSLNNTASTTVTIVNSPTISGISPTSGPSTGGTAVTITGSNFIGGGSFGVTIGGAVCANATVVNATSITCTTASGTVGAQNVVVTNYNGTSATLTGGFTYTASNVWTAAAAAPLAARHFHTAVWTGSKMIVWGGSNFSGGSQYNDGAQYDPVANSWTPTTLTGAPTARSAHSAVWTGTKMIIWGGYASGPALYNDGAQYDPVANSWTATAAVALAGRYFHTAVWTGSTMIVWGGTGGATYNDGAQYDPAANSWTTLTNPTGAPAARYFHTAVWTGSKMIVWGGLGGANLNDGAQYDPVGNSWTATAAVALAGRYFHTAVWTGSKMIIWGGNGSALYNDGAQYDPVANSWTATAPAALVARYQHVAVWTGSKMIIWGGYGSTPYMNDGAQYDPAANSWTATAAVALAGRSALTAVWTGSTIKTMIVWGGSGSSDYNDGAQYFP